MRDIDAAMDKAKAALMEQDPMREDKSDYARLTITVPPDMYEALIDELSKRRKARAAKGGFSGIVRDALANYFKL